MRDGYDAGGDGVARTIEAPDCPVHRDLALVRPVHAGKQAHQRRFAGAVLADQRMHFGGLHVEVHAI